MPVGFVRRAEQDDVGIGLRNLRCGFFGSDRVVGLALPRHPARSGALSNERIHRVGRREAEHRPPGAAERLHDVLHAPLVRAVPRPDLLGSEIVTEVLGESGAQRRELTVGVPVHLAQRDCDVVEDVAGHLVGHGMCVLVHVQCHRQRSLRCAVGGQAAQIVAERKVAEGSSHPSHRNGGVSSRTRRVTAISCPTCRAPAPSASRRSIALITACEGRTRARPTRRSTTECRPAAP